MKQEMEALMAGKTTLKSIFKSASSKESKIAELKYLIERQNQEVEDFGRLIHYVTIYISEVAIGKFKEEKAALYYKLMNMFSMREISNAHAFATQWHSLLDTINKNKQ